MRSGEGISAESLAADTDGTAELAVEQAEEAPERTQ